MIDVKSDKGDLMLSVQGQTLLCPFEAQWGVWDRASVSSAFFNLKDDFDSSPHLRNIKIDFRIDPVNLKLLGIAEHNFFENLYGGPGYLVAHTHGFNEKVAHHRLILFGINYDEIMRIRHCFPYTPILNRPPEFTGEDYFEQNGKKAFTTQKPEPYPVRYPLYKLLNYL